MEFIDNDIDFTTTTCLRPEILEQTYSSFNKNLVDVDLKKCTLYINIDPLPKYSGMDKSILINKTLEIANKYFGKVIYRTPFEPSFPAAVKWLWSMPGKKYTFHLEDDWILRECVSLEHVKRYINDKTIGVNLSAYIFPSDKMRICLSPGLFSTEWVNKVSTMMNTVMCPEKQLRLKTAETFRIDSKYILNCAKYPEKTVVVTDIGRAWRTSKRLHRGKNEKDYGFTIWSDQYTNI